MSITQLSTEIIQKIYEYATIKDVLHLSQTSKKNYKACHGRRKHLLQVAFYNSPYSPHDQLLKLVVAAEPDPIRKPVGTEIRRRLALDRVIRAGQLPPLSIELIMKMVQYAQIAERWVELYPQLRWRHDSNNRRLLRPHEAQRLRRAIYQVWTYHVLFHDQLFCEYSPERPGPGARFRDDLRRCLVRTWSTVDIVRQSEFMDKMRTLIEMDLYPSNTMLQHRYLEHLPPKALAKLAWGDDDTYEFLSNALMKFTPAEILHINAHTTTKRERLEYLQTKGKWFAIPSSYDAAISWMAADERVIPGRPQPLFPSTFICCAPPYVSLKDEDVQFGIIDEREDEHPLRYKSHVFANDASPTGEWVAEWQRSTHGRRMWMDEEGEESGASASESSPGEQESASEGTEDDDEGDL